MSMGYMGFAVLELEDENCLIYSYGCVNLNVPEGRNPNHERDGLIIIDKSCFLEPIITEKIKRQPGKRKKLIVKRHLVEVDFIKDYKEGRITIEPSKYDNPAIRGHQSPVVYLLMKIFREYQLQSKYPDSCGYCC